MNYNTLLFIFVVLGCSIILFLLVKILIDNLKREQSTNQKLRREISEIKSKLKSTEVRTGQIAEQFAPYLDGFPYDPKDVRFLGSPIDMVVFDFKGDQIVLIEFKTGESRETDRQKKIRQMIENGRCIYQVIRVKDQLSIKTTDPNTGSYSYE